MEMISLLRLALVLLCLCGGGGKEEGPPDNTIAHGAKASFGGHRFPVNFGVLMLGLGPF